MARMCVSVGKNPGVLRQSVEERHYVTVRSVATKLVRAERFDDEHDYVPVIMRSLAGEGRITIHRDDRSLDDADIVGAKPSSGLALHIFSDIRNYVGNRT